VHGLGFMAFGLEVQKFLNIEWFFDWKIKLNRSWKFRRNWNMPLIHTLQNNLHMLSFPILWWVHTWANGTGHTSLYYFWSNQKIIEVSIPWYYLFSWSSLTLKYQSELILGKNKFINLKPINPKPLILIKKLRFSRCWTGILILI